jgi:hypothetical protein
MKGNKMESNTKGLARFSAIMVMFALFISFTIPIAMAQSNQLFTFEDICIPATIDASHQIASTSASMSAGINGNVTVAFRITGVGRMTEIGSTRIDLFENNVHIATYIHTSTKDMMTTDSIIHAGTITYRGIAGRSYRANVTLIATNSSGTDSRFLQTNSIIAR